MKYPGTGIPVDLRERSIAHLRNVYSVFDNTIPALTSLCAVYPGAPERPKLLKLLILYYDTEYIHTYFTII